MQTVVDFLKVSGAGNDFVLVDNFSLSLSLDWAAFARSVCSRSFGVGADGLLVIEPSARASFTMHYYNADGSFGGMCGNGGRCVARYAVERGISNSPVTFEACGRIYNAEVAGETVELHLPDIKQQPKRERFAYPGKPEVEGWFVDSGSPHVVIQTDSLDSVDVDGIGRQIRYHPLVGTPGANVNFYHKGNPIRLRTYERGVEAETQACGTGAIATAVVSFVADGSAPPVSLHVRSGEELVVNFTRTSTGFSNISLRGSAHFVFLGTTFYEASRKSIFGPVLHPVEPHR
jgi:diaminopimelate epimerase